jgi:hypothetical protein
VICDRNGLPLAVPATAANVHGSQVLLPTLDCMPATLTRGRRRRLRSGRLPTHWMYDRWGVEVSMSEAYGPLPPGRRYERKGDHFGAFTTIGCTIIGDRRLTP